MGLFAPEVFSDSYSPLNVWYKKTRLCSICYIINTFCCMLYLYPYSPLSKSLIYIYSAKLLQVIVSVPDVMFHFIIFIFVCVDYLCNSLMVLIQFCLVLCVSSSGETQAGNLFGFTCTCVQTIYECNLFVCLCIS